MTSSNTPLSISARWCSVTSATQITPTPRPKEASSWVRIPSVPPVPRGHPRCGAHRRAFRPLPCTDTLQALGASTQRRQEHHRDHRLLSVTVFMAPREALSSRFFLLVLLGFAAVPRLVRSRRRSRPRQGLFPSPRLLSPFVLLVRCPRPEMTWCSARRVPQAQPDTTALGLARARQAPCAHLLMLALPGFCARLFPHVRTR